MTTDEPTYPLEEVELVDSHTELGVGAEAGRFRDDFTCCIVQGEDSLTPGTLYIFEKSLAFKSSRLVEHHFLLVELSLVVGVRFVDERVSSRVRDTFS